MRITNRQLKRIIKEEKRRLRLESVADMSHYESVVNRAGVEIAGVFSEDMYQLFHDPDTQDSGMFAGVEEGEWLDQVEAAKEQLTDSIAAAIEAEIEKTETLLHAGHFMRIQR